MDLVAKLVILGIAIVILYWLFFEFHLLEVIFDSIINVFKNFIGHIIDSFKGFIGSYI